MPSVLVNLEPEDKVQQWVDEFCQAAGINHWIPVMILPDSDDLGSIATAEVCPEHDPARDPESPTPTTCETCAIYIDPGIFALSEAMQRAVIAHEVAHYCLEHSGTWHYLDDTQGFWRFLQTAAVPSVILSHLPLRKFLRRHWNINSGALNAAQAVLAGVSLVGVWCAWRHAEEGQQVEMKADEMAVRRFGVVPNQEWKELLLEGDSLRQRIPVVSAFASHPRAKKRLAYVEKTTVQ